MIYIIITTCVHNLFGVRHFEHRRNTYLQSISKTLALLPKNIKTIIVENSGIEASYLDSFESDVI